MALKFLVGLLVVMMLGISGVYLSNQHSVTANADTQAYGANAMMLGNLASHYAAKNPSVTGVESPAALSAPPYYVPQPGLTAYVSQGSAYVYLAPNGPVAPSASLRDVATHTRNVLAGIKQASGAILDATGTVVASGVPAAIPNGSMVLVARAVGPSSAQTPPARGAPASLAALTTGAAIGGPSSYGNPTGAYVGWNPSTPLPPAAPPLPPPPPPPPPYIKADDPSACYATGGMPYTVTPSAIYSGVGAANFYGGAVNYFRGTTTARGTATGSYHFTIAFNGATQSLSLTCTRLNTDNTTIGDDCSYNQDFNVGGGTFNIAFDSTSPLKQDWVVGALAPYSAGVTITQKNCNP
ncbi:type IV pilus biogenesis protein PilM [Rhodanobacter denitrificans]|uniref:PilM n=1 Tax=Rhodanobacter denitrificans TaxID=666685 RepID=M4NGC5_9GAMM|nr:type IV pilus biogenesis protein PilM [Rhodanobacter denitrificans]AGG89142.1 PilM [Rhodanobacter denitrificans]UJJ52964.1 type IV pilus biogenesis protein PilM [Rhodanobacter denitrificans]